MAWPITEPTFPPSKLRLLVVHTDEGFSYLHNCHLLFAWSPIWSIYTLEISSALISICRLSTCWGMRLSFLKHHWIVWSLSCRLDAIEHAPLLWRRQLRHWYWSGLLARWRGFIFRISLVRWRRSTFGMLLVRWRKTNTSKSLLH